MHGVYVSVVSVYRYNTSVQSAVQIAIVFKNDLHLKKHPTTVCMFKKERQLLGREVCIYIPPIAGSEIRPLFYLSFRFS